MNLNENLSIEVIREAVRTSCDLIATLFNGAKGMNRLFKTTLCSGVALAAMAASVPAISQEITSSIRGVVTTPAGNPASGYSVIVTDTRTGAVQRTTTNANGVFAVRSLTVGGPFTIRVEGGQYEDVLITDITTGLSGTSSFNIALSEAQADLEEIVVVASAAAVTNLAIGPSSNFNLTTIARLPTISRQVRDIIRIDPRVSIGRADGGNGFGISCSGGNNRFNSFTIDGIRAADGFGLNASGNLARNTFPIPFDTIRAASVEFSPVDVEYGQFTGCNVNIVTKSGTNEFHGSAFFLYNNEDLQGDSLEGDQVLDPDVTFDRKNWGAELGGPIIKDKLFFYASYEETDTAGTQNDGPAGAGFANEEDVTLEQANRIRDILTSQYGRENLDIVRTLPQTSLRYFGRIDWNINDNHRLEATYARLEEGNLEPDDFGFGGFTFKDNFELEGSEDDTYSVRLFSNWTDNFSTEIRLSRNDHLDLQGPFGGGEAQDENIPRIEVEDGEGNILLTSGPGTFRSANALNYQLDQMKLAADYVSGDHTFTFGYELDNLSVFNLFAANATGTINFATIDDLEAGLAQEIDGNGSFSGDIRDAGATFSRNIHSLYIQDEWQATDALQITAGLRYDFYKSSDVPTESQAFVNRYGFSNAKGFDGLDILMPRLGLTYTLPEDSFGDTTITAGFGVFSGGDPTVWFSNAFSNFGGGIGGGETGRGTCTDADLQVINGGQFTGIPQCVIDQQQAEAAQGAGRIDAVDPDFKLASQNRYSFGIAHYTADTGVGFFDDWQINLDFIYSDARNTPDFVDLTLTPVGTAPDGRPIYNAINPELPGCNATFVGPRTGFNNVTDECDSGRDDQDILLTNSVGGDGSTTTISAQFQKDFDFSERTNLNFRAGYAFVDATVGNPTTSSTATSNFEEVAIANLNHPVVAQSQFSNKHNITIAATFQHEFIEDHPTSLGIFFRARSGRPFSYTFDGDTGEDFFGDTDDEERILFYVPTGPDDPLIDISGLSAADTTAFFNFLETSGLSEYAGQVSPRNAFEQPWSTDLDLRFQQDIPTPFEGHKLEFFLDFENFLNFLGDGNNIQRFADNGAIAEGVPVAPAAIANGQYVFTRFNPGGGDSSDFNFDPINDRDVDDSVWRIQVGLRYKF